MNSQQENEYNKLITIAAKRDLTINEQNELSYLSNMRIQEIKNSYNYKWDIKRLKMIR